MIVMTPVMNNNPSPDTTFTLSQLSVGSSIQNILFYGILLILLLVNAYLIRCNSNQFSSADQDKNKREDHPMASGESSIISDYRMILKANTALKTEINALKKEILDLGEELELSYIKADHLNERLQDIIGCMELTVFHEPHLWNWSIDASHNYLTLSAFGTFRSTARKMIY